MEDLLWVVVDLCLVDVGVPSAQELDSGVGEVSCVCGRRYLSERVA
jgi:hypothetical protein